MKQTVHMSVRKMLSCIVVLSVIIGMGMLASCSSNDKPGNGGSTFEKADLVVYGKIFTSDDNKVVEAFAVKDGKYVYVGDRTGAEAYVEAGKTEVVDYRGKGLVMPGCGNGHAHYSMAHALKSVGASVGLDDNPSKFLTEIVPAAVKQARDAGAKTIFGFGWNLHVFESNMPTRQQLDAICSDIPMYFSDNEGHKGPRSFLDNENLFSLDIASDILPKIEQQLLSEGYTMYVDGWGSYFFNTNFYQAAQQLDNAGGMHFVLGLSYEIESWMNIDEALAKAADAKKFASTRVKPNWIKLFMDGTVETGTGFVDPLYPDGHQGLPNWSEEQLTEMTRVANEYGVTMHIHAMGNKGVTRIINAFINGGKDEMRNTLVHVRNIDEADYKRMADHNFAPDGEAEYMREHGTVPAGQEDKSYPMKSYFDNGIIVTTHSDYPATSGSPDDPFGIMEIAVTGMFTGAIGKPYWTEELVTREQAITAMTINIAKQMFIEDERGSVSVGKYADFLLVNKDVLTCPVTEIHEAKPAATYFEGKKVFSM